MRVSVAYQFGKFCISGFINNIVNYLFFNISFTLGFTAVTGAIFGFIAGSIVSFFLNMTITFRCRFTGAILIRFWIAQSVILFLYSNSFYLIYVHLGLSKTLTWFAATAIATVGNFLVQKICVFTNTTKGSSLRDQ